MKIYSKYGYVIVDYPEAKSYGEAVSQALKDKVSFRGADLSGMSLRNLDFPYIFLYEAKCIGTDFTGSSFENEGEHPSVLAFSDFSGADFTGANLTKVDFAYSETKGADFTGATLKDNNFNHTKGNGKEIITIDADLYTVVVAGGMMHVDSVSFSIKEWLAFTDEDIEKINHQGVCGASVSMWWKEWKPRLTQMGVL